MRSPTLKQLLIPRALVVTPNLPEAAALLDAPPAANEAEMGKQGEAILSLGCKAVLVKGGHGTGAHSVDILVDRGGVHRYPARRFDTQNTHGTGCTLSSAIAAGLAKELPLADAVAAAKQFHHRRHRSGAPAVGRQGPRPGASFPRALAEGVKNSW